MTKFVFEMIVERGCPCEDGDCQGDIAGALGIEADDAMRAWREFLVHDGRVAIEDVLSQMNNPLTSIHVTIKEVTDE